MVPMCSATFRALSRSGAPFSPTANECSRGHQARVRESSSIRIALNRSAMAEMTEESSPPESSTPYGTSDIIWRFTAASRALRS